MISISGIRGIVGESLTPAIAVKYAAGFGEYLKRRQTGNLEVVLGRDGRVSGKILANIVSSTLLSTGVNVRALGVCPTPTIQLAVEHMHAAGGISITASHNPAQWNGMKFLASSGMFLTEAENNDLRRIADQGAVSYASWNTLGRHTADDSWVRKHVDLVLDLPLVDVETIRRRELKIVVDCVNGAGGVIVPILLQELGCSVIEMNCDVSGLFAHPPEPVPEHLSDLAQRVVAGKADLGIAVDPDGDRLVLINEKGEPYGEEYTIATAVKFVLGRNKDKGKSQKEKKKSEAGPAEVHGTGMQREEQGPETVVINLSTTRAVEDIAESYGARVVRTPVGEINVATTMKDAGAIIGGEGSGGIILPALHYGRDAIAGIPLILQLLVESGGTLSALKASMPQYAIAKSKVILEEKAPALLFQRLLESASHDARINTDDGLRVDFPDHWVHLRLSNTEPIIRIIAEARTPAAANGVVDRWKNKILSISGMK
jgi:phosphomannomutase